MEGQLNYNALSCYCTQTDSVRIAGEYPLAPKGKPKRRAPTTRQQQERTLEQPRVLVSFEIKLAAMPEPKSEPKLFPALFPGLLRIA